MNNLKAFYGCSLFCAAIIIILSSCSKEKYDFMFSELYSGTNLDLEAITFINDSTGFVCGGSRYSQGVLLKTNDGGVNWKNVSTQYMEKALYNFSFIKNDTGFCCGYDGKIFSTNDVGETWSFYQTYAWKPLRSIFMFNSRDGFSVGGNGFEKGCFLNWNIVEGYWHVDTTNAEYRDLYFFNRNEGLISAYGKILRTNDGGETWTITNANQDFFVSMSFVNDNVGYAIGYTGSILKTTDGGQTWDRLRNANSLFRPTAYFNKVIFKDENAGYIIGEKGCFMKTEDGGDHWSQIKNVPEINLKGIYLVNNGGYVCGEGGKIYRFLE